MIKKMNFSVFAVTVLAVVAMLISGGLGLANAYDLKWGTAPAGGVWQALGTAMVEDVVKENPDLRGSTLPIGGAANVTAVERGKINAAFSFSTTAAEAWEGKEFFKEQGELRNIRHLAVIFPEPSQIVVWKDSPIEAIEDLKGKSITPGPKGGAITVVSRYVLDAYGISFDDVNAKFLSFSEAGEQFIDGHIDSIFYGAMAFPAPPIVNASSQKDVKLLPLSENKIEKLLTKYKGLQSYTLQEGAYPGVDKETPGIAASVVVIVSKDMPDEVAYSIVKAIDGKFEKYGKVAKAMALGKREDMPQDIGVPMHPGAVKYYKEKGWLK